MTVLCDYEAIANSAPALTCVGEDSGALISLTPSMVLGKIPVSEAPDLDYLDKINFNKGHLKNLWNILREKL